MKREIKDSHGNKGGHIQVGVPEGKIDLARRTIEGNFGLFDVEAGAEVAGPVKLIASAKALTVNFKSGKRLLEGGFSVTLVEKGVGVDVGPVQAKVLVGLSAELRREGTKIRIKFLYGVGGEVEVDVKELKELVVTQFGAISLPVEPGMPVITFEPEEETSIRSSSTARVEPPPPEPPTRVRKHRAPRKRRVKYSEAYEQLGYPLRSSG